MTSNEDLQKARREFTQRLLDAQVLYSSGVPGVFGRSAAYQDVIRGFEAMVEAQTRKDGAERRMFTPLTAREVVRKVGYMDNFPTLCGSVHSFEGSDRDHLALTKTVGADEDWGKHLKQTGSVLTPAACYPLYPTLQGHALPEGGKSWDFTSWVFRHEPSEDPARMQSFQVKEGVRAGTPEDVQAWRNVWMERGKSLLESLEIPVKLEVANDPFFGRGGKLMAANQKAQALKFELLVPIFSEESPTAVGSFNYHQEHFGHTFDIRTSKGEVAHTACLGFGLDRIAVGLFKFHGLDTSRWPSAVRARLFP